MNKYLSDKLRIISFISIVMIVFLHSTNMNVNLNSGNINLNSGFNSFIQTLISQGLTRIAVPVFFLISGYLFFITFNGRFDDFVIKCKKRIKSLLLPYLIWSIWGVLFYFILQLFPQSKPFFIKGLVMNYTAAELLNTIFINPIPYQLWFVRDLMVLVVISPIIYWIIKYFRILPILLLFIVWLEIFKIDLFLFSNEAIFYFGLGGYIAICKSEIMLKVRSQNYYWIFFVIWISLLISKTILYNSNYESSSLLLILHKFSILTGVISVWSLYDISLINKLKPNKIMFDLSRYSFFIYAFHEPMLMIIKKGLVYITGPSEIMATISYLISPIIIICISIVVGSYIKKTTPKFYNLITGER